MEELGLFPAWKQAVKTLIDGGLTFGSTITRESIVELCRVQLPKSVSDVRRFDLEVLQCTSAIKEALLVAHCMLLASDSAGGYIVIRPEDQTRHAVEAGTKAVKREMGRMARGVSFIRSDLLSAQQRQNNADAQAKISKLAGMVLPANRELKHLINPEPEKP